MSMNPGYYVSAAEGIGPKYLAELHGYLMGVDPDESHDDLDMHNMETSDPDIWYQMTSDPHHAAWAANHNMQFALKSALAATVMDGLDDLVIGFSNWATARSSMMTVRSLMADIRTVDGDIVASGHIASANDMASEMFCLGNAVCSFATNVHSWDSSAMWNAANELALSSFDTSFSDIVQAAMTSAYDMVSIGPTTRWGSGFSEAFTALASLRPYLEGAIPSIGSVASFVPQSFWRNSFDAAISPVNQSWMSSITSALSTVRTLIDIVPADVYASIHSQALAAWEASFGSTGLGTAIADLVEAQNAAAYPGHARRLARFSAGMMGSGAVNTSAYVFGMLDMERDFANQQLQVRGDLTAKAHELGQAFVAATVKDIFGMVASRIEWWTQEIAQDISKLQTITNFGNAASQEMGNELNIKMQGANAQGMLSAEYDKAGLIFLDNTAGKVTSLDASDMQALQAMVAARLDETKTASGSAATATALMFDGDTKKLAFEGDLANKQIDFVVKASALQLQGFLGAWDAKKSLGGLLIEGTRIGIEMMNKSVIDQANVAERAATFDMDMYLKAGTFLGAVGGMAGYTPRVGVGEGAVMQMMPALAGAATGGLSLLGMLM